MHVGHTKHSLRIPKCRTNREPGRCSSCIQAVPRRHYGEAVRCQSKPCCLMVSTIYAQDGGQAVLVIRLTCPCECMQAGAGIQQP